MIWCISPLCLSIINILETSGKKYHIPQGKRKMKVQLGCLSLLKAPSWTFVIFISFSCIAMLICVYLKVSCGLEFLAELDFLLVRTLDGEELYTILPERKTIYLLIQHFECSGFLHYQRSEERRVGKECRSRWSPYH